MAFLYKLDFISRLNQMRCPVPSFLRDRMFLNVEEVEISNGSDEKGEMMIVRPVRRA